MIKLMMLAISVLLSHLSVQPVFAQSYSIEDLVGRTIDVTTRCSVYIKKCGSATQPCQYRHPVMDLRDTSSFLIEPSMEIGNLESGKEQGQHAIVVKGQLSLNPDSQRLSFDVLSTINFTGEDLHQNLISSSSLNREFEISPIINGQATGVEIENSFIVPNYIEPIYVGSERIRDPFQYISSCNVDFRLR